MNGTIEREKLLCLTNEEYTDVYYKILIEFFRLRGLMYSKVDC